jgi:hypothetical protein
MPIRRGSFSGGVALVPDVTIGATNNFNQAIATFNATVNPNGYTTSVQFQYSTNGSSWTNSGTVSNITGNSQSVYFNHDGAISGLSYLAVGTFYYVRAVATNQIGSTTSSNTTFTTWSLKTYANGTAGSYTVSIPGVTPTGGSPVAMTVYNIFIAGGGGGAGTGGGGAGGYRALSSRTFSNGSNQDLTVAIGGGGAARSAGGTTSISGTYWTTLSAGGGAGGAYNPPYGGSGGNQGSGDGSTTGGVGYSNLDKNSNPDPNNYSYGGGAGWGGNGGNGGDILDGPFRPGNGGPGATTTYGGYTGGAGGRAYSVMAGTGAYGSNGTYWAGYGSGGQAIDGAGVVGLVYFQYYGP